VLRRSADRLILRFDYMRCEMRVVGAMRKNLLKQMKAEPTAFCRTRPAARV